MWDLGLSRAAHQEGCITVVKSLPCAKTLRLSSASLESDSLGWGPRICILTKFPGDSDAQPGVGTTGPLCLTSRILKTLHYLTSQPNPPLFLPVL